MQQFTETPIHDFASHGADAFRTLAVSHRPPAEEKPKQRDPLAGMSAPAPGLGWMLTLLLAAQLLR